MKLSIAALTLGLTASATNAVRLTNKKISLTRQLLENSKYHSGAAPRSLEQEEFEVTGLHSVIFNSCETLSVQPNFDNNGDDNNYQIQSLYEKGAVRAQQSFVLFDVCQSDQCGNDGSKTTYITDLGSFIQAFAEFIPSKQEQYCEGCQENYNYCQYLANNSGNATVNGYANLYGNNNNNGRKLKGERVIEYIDCDRCNAFSCFDEDNGNGNGNNNANQNQAAYSLEWIQSMANCEGNNQNADGNGYYFQGAAVTTGFMCNQDGDGIEIAAFLDDECTLYTNQVAYGNLMNSYDYTYWSNSREIIQYMFTTEFSCYNPEMMFINPFDEQIGTYGDDLYNQNGDNNNGEYQAPEAAEWCRAVFESEMEVVPCGENDNYQYYQNENGQDENGNYQNTYATYGYLSEEDTRDGYAVCQALQGNGGQGEHLYDKKNSGSMYQYSGQKQGSKDAYGNGKIAKQSSNGLGTFFIIAFLVAGAVGVALFLKKKQLEQGGDKKEPLVKDDKGEMA